MFPIVIIFVTKVLSNERLKFLYRLDLNPQTAGSSLSTINIQNTVGAAFCPVNGVCPTSNYYRTMDGSCNNIQNPSWGKAHTPLKRLFSNFYDYGM